MNVGDIMTQEVVSVSPESTVREAAKLMLNERVSGLPVIDDKDALVGIISEGDFLRRSESRTEKTRPQWMEFFVGDSALADEFVKSNGRIIKEIMTRDVVTATVDMPLEKAVSLMEQKRVKRLPVVRSGRVVGIISRANFLRVLTVGLPHATVSRADKVIHDQIERDIRAHSWGGIFRRQIIVTDGVVDLWGFITSESQREAIRIAAENVPGVKRVRDHMLWFEPYTGLAVGTALNEEPPRPMAV